MKIGDYVFNYRKKNELSMDKFAEMSGLSKGYISMLEKNLNPNTGKPIIPTIETIATISKTIGVDINTLISSLDENQEINLNNTEDIKNTININDIDGDIAAHLNGKEFSDKAKQQILDFIDFVENKDKQ